VIDPGKLVAGLPEDISVILANLQAIAAAINGALDNGNLAPNAAIAISKLAGYPADGSKTLLGDGSWGNPSTAVGGAIPTGALFPFTAAAAPSGYLLCDGAAVSRSLYASLFSLIGVIYGTGDGSTTFNIPDIRGRVVAGAAVGGHADVATLGANDGVALASRRPRHNHSTSGLSGTLPNHGHSVGDSGHSHRLWMARFGGHDGGNFAFASGDQAGIFGFPAPGVDQNIQQSVEASASGVSVGNPTSNPAIGISGTVGQPGPTDSEAYIVLNYIIKT
jgi:microcystin-dependent protein